MQPAAKPHPQSPHRIAVNRRNARRSTGPRTAEGKAISRLNGLTHGLTCRVDLLGAADRNTIDAFSFPLAAELKTESAEQAWLAGRIAEEQWRLTHARDVENGWLAHAISTDAAADPTSEAPSDFRTAVSIALAFRDGERFLRLSLYEQRIHKQIEEYERRLNALKSESKAKNRFGFANDLFPDTP